MRTLKFIVDEQIIKVDPTCDFTGIVPGTDGYLQAEFSFSPEWKNLAKVVEFRRNGRECPPQLLKDGKSCMIPSQALTSRSFKLRVLGRGDDNFKLTTSYILVRQNGGKE